eukprot:4152787-Alexandrium_andersonii.AAC.1
MRSSARAAATTPRGATSAAVRVAAKPRARARGLSAERPACFLGAVALFWGSHRFQHKLFVDASAGHGGDATVRNAR